MRRLLIVALLVAAGALTSALVLSFDAPDPALLPNGDFEQGDSGWQMNVGGILSVVGDPSGDDHAARITLTSAVAFLSHPINFQTGHSYSFMGTFVAGTSDVAWVQPSLPLYDALGGELGPQGGAMQVLEPSDWSLETTDGSCEAVSAQVRVAIAGSPGAIAYIDDLGLKSVPPETPCATDTPTAVPTDTPSATPTVTNTGTPTPTRTPTSTRTATPTRTPSPTRTATATSELLPNSTPTQPAVVASPTDASSPTSTPTLTPSNGLLINGGFEASDGDALAAWRHFGGELLQTAEQVRSGEFAARLASATTSTKWAYQTVAVEPGGWYQFDAFVLADDPGVDAAWLRVSWYGSADASGSALATADSTKSLTAPDPAFRSLSTGSVQAPATARSANVRIVLRPVSAGEASIFIDDVSFVVAEPATPTPSMTTPPTASPTPPMPTATATVTGTPTPTRTSTPTRTATLTRTPTPTRSQSSPPAVDSTMTVTSEPGSVNETATRRPSSTPTRVLATATAIATRPTPSNGLLLNGGFEVIDSGKLLGWETYGGEATRVDAPVLTGSYAGAFTSSTESTKWLYQPLTIEAESWYTFSAHVLASDGEVEAALLRISWYASDDASGSAIGSTDSTEALVEPAGSYRHLTTGSVQAPPNARSAKARVVVRPRGAALATVFVDDAWFVVSDPVAAAVDAPEFETTEPSDPDGPTLSARSTSRSTAGASSQVAGVARSPDVAPQPSPVIRRGAPQAIDAARDPAGASSRNDWWRWALPIGVAAAIGGAGWGAWWRDRRRAPPV